MERYIDRKLQSYGSVEALASGKGGTPLSLKQLITLPHKLQIYKGATLLGEVQDIQPLYLCPATVLDYIHAWLRLRSSKKLLPVQMFIFDQCEMSPQRAFEGIDLSELKSVEILLDGLGVKSSAEVLQTVEYFQKLGVAICLNIPDLKIVPQSFLSKLQKQVTYFKIFLFDDFGTPEFDEFLQKLRQVQNCRAANSVVHVKTYLSEERSAGYGKVVAALNGMADVFQVSKALLDEGANNEPVRDEVQRQIRSLQKTYDGANGIKFVSVKNLSTLFYPRFELDERNSKNCYACVLRPYVYNGCTLPCKVKKMLQSKERYKTYDMASQTARKSFEEFGRDCDDCASIFENDFLESINKIIGNNDVEKLLFVIVKEESS